MGGLLLPTSFHHTHGSLEAAGSWKAIATLTIKNLFRNHGSFLLFKGHLLCSDATSGSGITSIYTLLDKDTAALLQASSSSEATHSACTDGSGSSRVAFLRHVSYLFSICMLCTHASLDSSQLLVLTGMRSNLHKYQYFCSHACDGEREVSLSPTRRGKLVCLNNNGAGAGHTQMRMRMGDNWELNTITCLTLHPD